MVEREIQRIAPEQPEEFVKVKPNSRPSGNSILQLEHKPSVQKNLYLDDQLVIFVGAVAVDHKNQTMWLVQDGVNGLWRHPSVQRAFGESLEYTAGRAVFELTGQWANIKSGKPISTQYTRYTDMANPLGRWSMRLLFSATIDRQRSTRINEHRGPFLCQETGNFKDIILNDHLDEFEKASTRIVLWETYGLGHSFTNIDERATSNGLLTTFRPDRFGKFRRSFSDVEINPKQTRSVQDTHGGPRRNVTGSADR